jgi:RNA polymerase sigma-70 factor (ECF subfamily)
MNQLTADHTYRRHEAALLRYARSITRNADDASDALQNAWVKLLAAGHDEPPRPLLFRVVHNESVSILRRRRPSELLADDSAAVAVAGPDERYAQRERAHELLRDLRELPEGQRAAFVLRELEDRDYDEIAAALGVTANNARQLVFAARSSIQDVESGRGLECERVRAHILHTGEDGRLRRRTLRAHLRSCGACRDFAGARRPVRRRLLAWWPFGTAPLLAGAAVSPAGPAVLRGAAALVASIAATTGVITLEPPQPAEPHAAAAARAKRKANRPAAAKLAPVAVTTVAQATTTKRAAAQPAKATASKPKPRATKAAASVTATTTTTSDPQARRADTKADRLQESDAPDKSPQRGDTQPAREQQPAAQQHGDGDRALSGNAQEPRS